MKNLNKTIKIDPKFTAAEWQLRSFRDNPAKTAVVSLSVIALDLNKALKTAVNKAGSTRQSVWKDVYSRFGKYAEYGASNIESRSFLVDILTDIYGPSF